MILKLRRVSINTISPFEVRIISTLEKVRSLGNLVALSPLAHSYP